MKRHQKKNNLSIIYIYNFNSFTDFYTFFFISFQFLGYIATAVRRMYLHFGKSGSSKTTHDSIQALTSCSSSRDLLHKLCEETNAITSLSTAAPGDNGQFTEDGSNVITSPRQGDHPHVRPQNGVGAEIPASEGAGVATAHQHMANTKNKKKKKKATKRFAKIQSSSTGVSEADTVAAESVAPADASSTDEVSDEASLLPSSSLSTCSSSQSLLTVAISASTNSDCNDNGGGYEVTDPGESVPVNVPASDGADSSLVVATPPGNRKQPINGSVSAPILKSKKLKKSLSRTLSNLDFDKCSPEICVTLMHRPTIQNVGALKRKLKSCSTEWLHAFVTKGGLDNLLDYSSGERHLHQLSDALLLLECISCVRVVMNSRQGLEYIINTHYTTKLIKSKLIFSILTILSLNRFVDL